MTHCAHCGVGECELTGSNPTVMKCNNCGTHWTDCDNLAERLGGFEARMERMERAITLMASFIRAPSEPSDEQDEVRLLLYIIRKALADGEKVAR